ncbi:MAG: hypothetical protein JWM40_904 [Frankiales bacterium]|nr:hypothetical protein [Frankiales bacterium]
MTDETLTTVSVTRRIASSAEAIFEVLATPSRHRDYDGSRMLRGTESGPITAVGDAFVMNMYFLPLGGDYSMINHVVEFEAGRLIAWEPENGPGHLEVGAPNARWGHRWRFELEPDGPEATVVTETWDGTGIPAEDAEDGRQWIPSMEKTLERLDQLLTGA